jgi:hypothetical protein
MRIPYLYVDTLTDIMKPKDLLVPSVLRGSLIRFRRKCGKPNCHCAHGEPHSSSALSYSDQGKTKLLTLPAHLVPKVRAALQLYRKDVQALERQANAGLRRLAEQLRQNRSAP